MPQVLAAVRAAMKEWSAIGEVGSVEQQLLLLRNERILIDRRKMIGLLHDQAGQAADVDIVLDEAGTRVLREYRWDGENDPRMGGRAESLSTTLAPDPP